MKPQKSDDRQQERLTPTHDPDPDMAGAEAALRRAAEVARRRAAENGNAIAIFEDGKIVWMEVDKESLSLRRPRGDALSEGATGVVNLNVRIPAVELLVKYVASGIGAVAGPMLAPWKARREAKAKIIETKADADSLKLIAHAQDEARRTLLKPYNEVRGVLEMDPDSIRQRIEFQEKKRHTNIASVVRGAAAELDGKDVDDHEPDPDWTARFFDNVQDISSEDMRKIWARILAGEVREPGRTSLRTLDVLRNMTSKDARTFERICDFVINGEFIFYYRNRSGGHQELSLGNLISLQEAGLLHVDSSFSNRFPLGEADEQGRRLLYQDRLLIISAKATSKTDPSVSVPMLPLTRSGKELFTIAECTFRMDYLKSLSQFLRGRGCELSSAVIIERHPDGQVRYDPPFTPIDLEPEPSRDATS